MKNISFSEAVDNFNKISDLQENFTFDPVACKSYDIGNLDESQKLYEQYGNGKDPIYLIGVTNNTTDQLLDPMIKKAYSDLQNDGKMPLFGQWTSPISGQKFKDVSYVEKDISESEAIALKTLFNQEGVLKIMPNGRWELI